MRARIYGPGQGWLQVIRYLLIYLTFKNLSIYSMKYKNQVGSVAKVIEAKDLCKLYPTQSAV